MKASQTFHDAVVEHRHHGCFAEPSSSLRGAFPKPSRSLQLINKPPVTPQLPDGRFHSESVMPPAQPYGVILFGLVRVKAKVL